MKSIEFMYWLQSSFEVCEIEQYNVEQLKKIKNHLKMVDIVDGKQIYPFCTWLKGFLDAVETEVPSVEQTTKIKNKLNNLFEHVVQPTSSEEDNVIKPLSSIQTMPLINC